jgi:dihydropteroate synthase-like protein
MSASAPRIVFVTGKLAEPALRRTVADLAEQLPMQPEIVVLPITVAALLTTEWIARHWQPPAEADRVILPGLVRGDLQAILHPCVERGPADLRDLPEYFGKTRSMTSSYGPYDIQILAEINHAAQLSRSELLEQARDLHADGADIIDLGCDPGGTWVDIDAAVRALRDEGMRVSIDSWNTDEVERGLAAGAELVLSVNGSNVHRAKEWSERWDAEVVAIPDTPCDLDSLNRTIERLRDMRVRFRIDPILEPIGLGFAASLGRYLQVRQLYPDAEMLMGVGNVTELTDADSAGINVVLVGFCQELGIRSVLTTQVANWCRSCVQELSLARRLVHYAVKHRTPPKRLEPNLVILRDPKLRPLSEQAINELAEAIKDRNYRLFAVNDRIHIVNSLLHFTGHDPFELLRQLLTHDTLLTPSHAFYLGYEMAKAITALTLGKEYVQDQPLRWGFLTQAENSHPPPNDDT